MLACCIYFNAIEINEKKITAEHWIPMNQYRKIREILSQIKSFFIAHQNFLICKKIIWIWRWEAINAFEKHCGLSLRNVEIHFFFKQQQFPESRRHLILQKQDHADFVLRFTSHREILISKQGLHRQMLKYSYKDIYKKKTTKYFHNCIASLHLNAGWMWNACR